MMIKMDVTMTVREILSKMTLEEKISLCSGADFFNTKGLNKYGIPSVMLSDGPHGLRKQEDAADHLGVNPSVPATCFPTAALTACSWDEELLGEVGEAIAQEAATNDVAIILGPGANIKRNPLCGRSFEYFSEDPYLSGKLAASYIKKAESVGIGCSLKHFALNNQEYKRFSSDSIADERTMREMYLAGFEIAVKEGKPSTVMSAYNKINGEHCSDNKRLLTDILRDEWGFDGMVVTDWGGMSDRIKGFQAGSDLVMPGGSSYMEPESVQAVKDGVLSEKDVDKCAGRVLGLVFDKAEALRNAKPSDMGAHHALAQKAAQESAVLLKNDEEILPLSTSQNIVFIGSMAKTPRYQGNGSSHINPWKLVSAIDACPEIPFSMGCDEDGNVTDKLLCEAVISAKKADVAVVFAGLPSRYESEGFERDDMKMPDGHIRLIECVANANPNTIVVLSCGCVIELPWNDKVKAILYMGLPGQAGGAAIKSLLFGDTVPSGKLAESWPIQYEDCVSSSYYSLGKKDAHYREGIYVGYRYYSSSNTPVRYSFGHGLSYSNFTYSDLEIEENAVSFTLTNAGKIPAKEISQLYIAPPQDSVYRPAKELKAFAKTFLQPGESKSVLLRLSERSFSVWDGNWVVPGGTYGILVGSGSEDIRLCGEITLQGVSLQDNAPKWYHTSNGTPSHSDWELLLGRSVRDASLIKGSFTMDNTVVEMKDYSLIMRIMFKAIEATVAKGFGGKKDYNDPKFRMMITSAADAALSSMKISGGMKSYVLEGMLAMANGHFFKGLRLMCKKVK